MTQIIVRILKYRLAKLIIRAATALLMFGLAYGLAQAEANGVNDRTGVTDTPNDRTGVTDTPGRFERLHPFKGTGVGGTEAQAFDLAYQSALTALIQEQFSVSYSVSDEIQQSTTNTVRSSRFMAEIGEVKLDGIKLSDSSKRTLPSGLIEVTAEYTVPASILEMAKRRVALGAGRDHKKSTVKGLAEMTAIGSGNLYRANLVVETVPSGALVTISEGLVLPSPLSLMGMIEPGEITLRIDHPDYEPKLVRISAVAGKTSTVREKLERAGVRIGIDSTPKSAVVTVGGRVIGKTPTAIDSLAGQILDVELSHPDAKTVRKQIKVYRSPHYQEVNVLLEYNPTYLQIVSPEVAGRFTVGRSFRTTEVPRGRPIQLDAGEYKVCFEPISKDVASTISCGSKCCKSVTLEPGRLNMTGFHEELRESAVGPARRELRGEILVPVKSESTASAVTSVESKPLKLPDLDIKNQFTFGGSVQSLSIAKTTVPLIGLSLGLLSLWERRVYFEGAGEIGFGDGNESLKKYSLSGVVTTELAGGLVLNPDSDIVIAVDYRVGQRRGTLKLEDRTAIITQTTTESFEQKLKGPCLKISEGAVDGTGVGLEVWAFQAEGNSKTVAPVNGVRFRMGFYHGF